MTDFQKLSEFLDNGKVKNAKKSKYTGFRNYEGVYLFSNEDLSALKLDHPSSKKIAIVTSSADQILHFIKEGTKDIDAFDINVFSKYIARLKYYMIRKYKKEEYFNFLLNFDKPEILSFVLLDICNYLTEEDLSFWGIYYKSLLTNKNKEAYNLLFGNQKFIEDISKLSYYDKKSYNKIKKNIDEVNVNYVDSSLEKLKPSKKYDILYISNLIQRIYEYYTISGIEINDKKDDAIKSVIKSSFNILNDDGTLIDYYLGRNYLDLQNIFGSYYNEFSKKFSINKQSTSNGNIYTYKRI